MNNVVNFLEYKIKYMEEKCVKDIPMIQSMKEELSEEDYCDFLEGCNNYDFYQTLDVDMQNLVNAYWSHVS